MASQLPVMGFCCILMKPRETKLSGCQKNPGVCLFLVPQTQAPAPAADELRPVGKPRLNLLNLGSV